MVEQLKNIVHDFKIKGIGDVLLVRFGDGIWEEELHRFLDFIEKKKDFFLEAKLALDVGERNVKAVQMADLRDALAERGILLIAIFSESKQTKNTAKTYGLEIEPERIRTSSQKKTQFMPNGGENAIVYPHTLRSGVKVKYFGSVIVIGDVNPGAEIEAEGNVVVWGCVRGSVLAGTGGDESVVICALELKPLHLRIANIEAKKSLHIKNPVKINCQEAELHFSDWKQ